MHIKSSSLDLPYLLIEAWNVKGSLYFLTKSWNIKKLKKNRVYSLNLPRPNFFIIQFIGRALEDIVTVL